MLLLHGVVQGCIGTSHRWYVPVYTCLALALANGNADLSFDRWASQRWGASYPFAPVCASAATSNSIVCSGFARKLVLLFGISTLFFGAITKFINGGLAWLDGESLSYYVSSEENGRSVTLKNLMHKHRWISLALSLASIGLEAGSIVAVFFPATRPLILVSAAGMHLGIWLTMWPNYFPQTLCYALGMSWSWFGERSAGELFKFDPSSNSTLLMVCWLAVSLWIFLGMVACLRIEWWPLTGIPMYSFYRDGTYSYKHLRDASQAQQVALEHAGSGYPNALAWSNLWINLRLKNMDPSVTEERRARKLTAAAAASHNGASPSSPESPLDSYVSDNAFADAAKLSASLESAVAASSASSSSERKSAESSGLTSSEREFVNLKSRVTDFAYTRRGRSGVYLKQWRRTLHNVAAADMSAKPLGGIEHNASGSDAEPYPALEWLRRMLPHLRVYARVNSWNLPAWVESTGELQLRVKLKERYAILARIPWNAVGSVTKELGGAEEGTAANIGSKEEKESSNTGTARQSGRASPDDNGNAFDAAASGASFGLSPSPSPPSPSPSTASRTIRKPSRAAAAAVEDAGGEVEEASASPAAPRTPVARAGSIKKRRGSKSAGSGKKK